MNTVTLTKSCAGSEYREFGDSLFICKLAIQGLWGSQRNRRCHVYPGDYLTAEGVSWVQDG